MTPLPSTQFALRRTIPSRLEAVDALCLEIRSLFEKNGLAAKAFIVELLARECLNNAVLHGNGSNRRKHVSLELLCARKWIHLHITDEGPGFNWRRRFTGSLPERTANHGRGMPIITQFADRARFNRRGNQISLWLLKDSKPKCKHP
jgi:serine/threonine-protein kinase RsbW